MSDNDELDSLPSSTSQRKKSLADEIFELTNPAPKDIDPEMPDWDTSRLEFENDISENVSHSKKFEMAPVKRTLKAEPVMGEEYRGKKISREEFERQKEGDEEDSPDVLDEKSDSESSSEKEDNEHFEVLIGEMESSDESMEEKQEEQQELLSNLKTVEEALRLEKQLQEEIEAEKQAIQNLQEATKEENIKAQHTKNQRTVWDSLLDLRIRLQQLLTTSNCFPQFDIFSEFIDYIKQKDPNFQHLHVSLINDIFGLINDLLDLQFALKENNEETATLDISNPHSKEDGTHPNQSTDTFQVIDSLWESLFTTQEAFSSYQNEIIEKWNSKTLIQSGVNLNKLKALNQSPVKQVEQILRQNKEKILKRSQLKREDYKILGKRQITTQNTKCEVLLKREKDNPNDYDEEIYDDGDFYEMLLKELIESGISDISDPIEMTRKYLNLRKLRKKRTRNVDRRASKGRKIKYVIHEKLVNFMAPQPNRYPLAYTETANQLFASLFGKKLNIQTEENTPSTLTEPTNNETSSVLFTTAQVTDQTPSNS